MSKISTSSHIQVVDLFAGPGGLGEGFSSLQDGKVFQIAVSAEKDPIAHQTLLLRAFYRLLKNKRPEKLDDYYKFCNGETKSPFSSLTEDLWIQAKEEALCIEIGNIDDNKTLDRSINKALTNNNISKPWILIGGPPCQAYSLVGRARNKGKIDYRPEEDHRHFLYREYLRIIQQYQPDIFVMENVKGILSSTINGKKIFHQILSDLSNPDIALKKPQTGHSYRIVSLTCDQEFHYGDDPCAIDATKYIIKAEEYGIPQARHRVILLGIREDRYKDKLPKLKTVDKYLSVHDVIGTLPALRSQLSKQKDSSINWRKNVSEHLNQLADAAEEHDTNNILARGLRTYSKLIANKTDLIEPNTPIFKLKQVSTGTPDLDAWFLDDKLNLWLNHEARGHRIDDLTRYGYAAIFSKIYKRSPKGHKEFNLPGLAPAHKNWESGKFSDRFRVQIENKPSTTITSHISKDGHYFIHYDPEQCRSLTVREAARLQTFPDNYYFQGGRTHQYHQVGNAVPPLLANKIAHIVSIILNDTGIDKNKFIEA